MKKGINVLVILFVLFSFVFIPSCGKDNDSIQDEMNNKINLINDKIANNESYFNEKINSLTTSYENNKNSLTKQNEELKEELYNLNDLLDSKVKNLENKLKVEKESLQTEILSNKVELDKQLTNFQSEYNNKINDLLTADEESKKELLLEISKLENSIDSINAEIKSLEEKFENSVIELENLIETEKNEIISNINSQIDEINEKIELNNQLISSNKEELENSLANIKKEYADMILSIENEIAALDAQDKVILDRLDAIDNLLDLLLEKEYFVVQFNSNGGSNVESQLIEKYNKVVLPETPTKNGYDFLGWYVDDEKWSFIGYSVTEDITLTAKWANSEYSINYELNGGLFVENNAALNYKYQDNVEIPNPVKAGHTFLGWTVNGSIDMVKNFSIIPTTYGNISLVANWQVNTYKLTYVYDNVLDIINVEYGDEVSLKQLNKNGYDFKGWNYGLELYSNKMTYNFEMDIYLYANWDVIQYTISYDLDGGEFYSFADIIYSYNIENEVVLPTPRKMGYKFIGWFNHADYSGNAVTTISKGEYGNKIFFAKWDKGVPGMINNPTLFDGQGMDYVIKVYPVSDYDPFDPSYTGSNKSLKQAYHKFVEDSYNINVVYSEWGGEAAWGPMRVEFIKNSFTDGSFQRDNVYAVALNTQWIPTLVESNCLAELYNLQTEEGIFNDYYYIQDSIINESLSVRYRVYGFDLDKARPDSFIYYNIDKIKEIGMKDPAELWFTGKWTWSNFEEWVIDAQSRLAYNEYALDFTAADFIINAAPAQGTKMVNANRGTLNFTKRAVTSIIEKMKAYYNDGYWDKAHGVQDVAFNFISGHTLLHTGYLWFLKDSTRFAPSYEDGGIQFKIGVVPYPVADDSVVNVYTNPYSYFDTSNNVVEVNEPIIGRDGNPLKTSEGKTVYGIDLSLSSFMVPYRGYPNEAFSIMNYQGEGMNGINSSIAFSILHDLQYAMSDAFINEDLSEDELYRQYLNTKLDYPIDVEVVMSVQDQSLMYYELIETLSMTVGYGSHFGPNAFWPLMSYIMYSEDTPETLLGQVEEVYLEALRSLGY